jgi:hypothetical protein
MMKEQLERNGADQTSSSKAPSTGHQASNERGHRVGQETEVENRMKSGLSSN